MKWLLLLLPALLPALLIATPQKRCDDFVTHQIDIFCSGKKPKVAAAIKGVFEPNRKQMVSRCVAHFDQKVIACGMRSDSVKTFMSCDPQKQVIMVQFRKKVSAQEAINYLAAPKAGDSLKRKKCKKVTANMINIIKGKTGLPMIPDSKKFNGMVDSCEKQSMKKIDCQVNAKNSDQLKKCKDIK